LGRVLLHIRALPVSLISPFRAPILKANMSAPAPSDEQKCPLGAHAPRVLGIDYRAESGELQSQLSRAKALFHFRIRLRALMEG
jgi:hypothetical protein